jgi:hypothetical protein
LTLTLDPFCALPCRALCFGFGLFFAFFFGFGFGFAFTTGAGAAKLPNPSNVTLDGVAKIGGAPGKP